MGLMAWLKTARPADESRRRGCGKCKCNLLRFGTLEGSSTFPHLPRPSVAFLDLPSPSSMLVLFSMSTSRSFDPSKGTILQLDSQHPTQRRQVHILSPAPDRVWRGLRTYQLGRAANAELPMCNI